MGAIIVDIALLIFLVVKTIQIKQIFNANNDIPVTSNLRIILPMLYIGIAVVTLLAFYDISTGDGNMMYVIIKGMIVVSGVQACHVNVKNKFEQLRNIYSYGGESTKKALAEEREQSNENLKRNFMMIGLVFAAVAAMSVIKIILG